MRWREWIWLGSIGLFLGCDSPCENACETVNDLECRSCDCAACADAPASCDEYFDCINDSNSCLEVGLGCSAPPECSSFANQHCGN